MVGGSGDTISDTLGLWKHLRSRFKSGLACYSLAPHTREDKDRAWQVAWAAGASAPALAEKGASMFHGCCHHAKVLNFGTTLVFSFCMRAQVLGGFCFCFVLFYL